MSNNTSKIIHTQQSMNKNLHSAKKTKNDEFYTQLTDIEQELKHYWKYLENKIILCNCDDPECSKFTFYFKEKFKDLKLKKLICTCYKHQSFSIFQMEDKPSNQAIAFEYDGKKEKIIKLKGDGDFRSEECLKYLKECDIVITNPPFSLFREFIAKLVEYNKKFLVIGNPNAITYKEIFKLIKDNKLWLGNKSLGTDTYFEVPEAQKEKFKQTGKEGSNYVIKNGNILGRAMATWFTNIPHTKRNEELILWAKYNEKDYPKYDNYDAINVDKVNQIPKDYFKPMGVPISFLDKYNPNQFEIIDINPHFFSIIEQGLPKPKQLHITGKKDPYARIIIQRRKQ